MTTSDALVAVVTGANSGIGRAVAIHLATRGITVYGTVRSVDKATKLIAMASDVGAEVHLVELDVADDESVRAGLATVHDGAGKVDVLVNNAGVGGNGVVEETPIERYAEVININLFGAIRCLKAVLPGMRRRRSGAIVNVMAVAGRFASPAQAPYVASKWAFEGVSEQLAHELAPFGILVAIIEPGVTKSAIFAKNTDFGGDRDYAPHWRRMFQFYAAGRAKRQRPLRRRHHRLPRDHHQLTEAALPGVSWGGPEIIANRQRITDEQSVTLGDIANDDEYYHAFHDHFGFDIAPRPA
jgi:NAD(P)-dependent dehydrogenase (short-subunit alcohol dehydrogenase family)